MGSLTFEVQAWRVSSQLREEFAIPASQEPADAARLKTILAEIEKLTERVHSGDDRMYSEVLGCWVRVVE